MMHFQHHPQIWQNFPALVCGVLVVDGMHQDVDAGPVMERWLKQARRQLEKGPESQIPAVTAWRRAYTQMGLKPTKYRSAAEALLRRFRKEDDIPRLHPLVDLCNAVSLAFALPVAVFDLDQVDSFLEVRYARGDENYLAFNGEVEHPARGEIVFSDKAEQIHARRWTFRQSRLSTVGAATKRVLIISEGLHEYADKDIPELFDVLADNIGHLWAESGQTEILSANEPRIEFPDGREQVG